MNCKNCNKECQKWGRQKNGRQRFYCMNCKKSQQSSYTYSAYNINVLKMIPQLVCESVSIRGIARILKISTVTVMSKIKGIAASILKPAIPIHKKVFELDELRTYIGNKENQYWVAYALCSETKKVIDFTVGKRSKRTLRTVVNTLLLSGVKTIKTDKLNIYQSLIPKNRHISAAYTINHIERNNLNLRTHLKRLSRRTICFSKSLSMLEACLKIYFWGMAVVMPPGIRHNVS
jgi:IS1 family transposase/transposase-like protein